MSQFASNGGEKTVLKVIEKLPPIFMHKSVDLRTIYGTSIYLRCDNHQIGKK